MLWQMQTTIQNRKIKLFSWIEGNPPVRVIKSASVPVQEWEGQEINLIDWKIDGETVLVTYQTRRDLYAPILDAKLPLVFDREPLPAPNRSKNWTWQESSCGWFNRKTGQRVSVFH
jgi:hypothetical protein